MKIVFTRIFRIKNTIKINQYGKGLLNNESITTTSVLRSGIKYVVK